MLYLYCIAILYIYTDLVSIGEPWTRRFATANRSRVGIRVTEISHHGSRGRGRSGTNFPLVYFDYTQNLVAVSHTVCGHVGDSIFWDVGHNPWDDASLRNTHLPHIVPIRFRPSRSNARSIRTENHWKIGPLCPDFQGTGGHCNWRRSIGYLWLPISGRISYRFRDKRRFRSKIAKSS